MKPSGKNNAGVRAFVVTGRAHLVKLVVTIGADHAALHFQIPNVETRPTNRKGDHRERSQPGARRRPVQADAPVRACDRRFSCWPLRRRGVWTMNKPQSKPAIISVNIFYRDQYRLPGSRFTHEPTVTRLPEAEGRWLPITVITFTDGSTKELCPGESLCLAHPDEAAAEQAHEERLWGKDRH